MDMASDGEVLSARSWLFAPGDSQRKMEKAAAGPADIVIFDLEDAVTEAAKPTARAMVPAFLKAQAEGRPAQAHWCRSRPARCRA